jgi:hypothetical protein
MKLYDLIITSAEQALSEQSEDGSMASGHNGPYKDPETPVRNTAHWAMIFFKVFELTEDKKYLEAARECVGYLLSRDARPMGASFWCRKNPTKDFANGLVGQAWTIEALVKAKDLLSNQEAIAVAEEVFLLHPFSEKLGAWKRVNVDGSLNTYDMTFNHQLWFAAAGALICQQSSNEQIKKQVIRFLDLLENNLAIYPNGLIRHKSYKYLTPGKFGRLKNLYYLRSIPKAYLKMKSLGYHGFNLYAFVMLKEVFPDHRFWNCTGYKKSMEFAKSDELWQTIETSKYGFPYNPPGFEIGYALQHLGVAENLTKKWVSRQIKTCWDNDTKKMIKGGTFDENTAAARLYEAIRLNNYELDVS